MLKDADVKPDRQDPWLLGMEAFLCIREVLFFGVQSLNFEQLENCFE